MKKLIPFIKHPIYFPIGLFCILGLILILLESSDEEQTQNFPEAMESADTLIPYGYVLVPLQLTNEATLHSILGDFGIVDLFLPSEPGQQGEQVANDVKIIRAPRNPSQFAVLIHEDQSQELVKKGGPFIAVIQNPTKKEGEVFQPQISRSRISYGK